MQNLIGSNILVLGGSGFIGKNLCRALAKRNAYVTCFSLDNPFADDYLNAYKKRIRWVQGNFNDFNENYKDILDNVDIVYHLICTTIPASSNEDIIYDLESNTISTLRFLEMLKAFKSKKIIFVSSGGTVYGEPAIVPTPEDHPTNPICSYGIHKLAIEKYLFLFNHLYGLEYRISRLGNPYGINQISDRPQGVIGNFLHKVIQKQPIDIWGDGSALRDYIYIDDAIEALVSLIQYNGASRIFNIGSGEGKSIIDIVNIIRETVGFDPVIRYHPSRSTDLSVNILDIRNAISQLNWKPKTDLKSGIEFIYRNSRKN